MAIINYHSYTHIAGVTLYVKKGVHRPVTLMFAFDYAKDIWIMSNQILLNFITYNNKENIENIEGSL